MCEPADGDVVDAGARDGPDVGERDAAGHLQERRRVKGEGRRGPESYGFSDVSEAPVIQENRVRPCAQSSGKLPEIDHLDFNESSRSHALRFIDRDFNQCVSLRPSPPTLRPQVVGLDQDGFRKIRAMTLPSPRPDRLLLQRAQAGERLAGVEDHGARPAGALREGAGQRGDAGEVAEQVQRSPLRGEDGARPALDRQDGCPGRKPRAGTRVEPAPQRGVERGEGQRGYPDAGGDARRLGHDARPDAGVSRDHRARGDVALGGVFLERQADELECGCTIHLVS